MNQKRLKIGILVFMAVILLCAGRMVYVDAIAARNNNKTSWKGAAKDPETVSGPAVTSVTISGEMRAVWIYYNRRLLTVSGKNISIRHLIPARQIR